MIITKQYTIWGMMVLKQVEDGGRGAENRDAFAAAAAAASSSSAPSSYIIR